MNAANRVLLTMRMIAKSMVTPFRPYAGGKCKLQTTCSSQMSQKCHCGNAKPVLAFRPIVLFEGPVHPNNRHHLVSQIGFSMNRIGFSQPALVYREFPKCTHLPSIG